MNVKRSLMRAGFTMIELLVVIAVIGVLAVAVLSSINPIEQINKGRDTRTRSDAAQLINAVDRFYATQEHYPWNDTNYACGAGGTCSPALTTAAGQDPATVFPTNANFVGVCAPESAGAIGVGTCKVNAIGGKWLDALGDKGTSEVKGGFIPRIQAQTTYAIYAYKGTGTTAALETCFRPSSFAFQAEALKNCRDSNTVTAWGDTLKVAACPSGTGTVGDATYQQSTDKNELICLP